MVDTIACFLTCGYTEAGEMQGFLRRCLRSEIRLKQCLPNKPRLRKDSPKMINPNFNGLTHESLLEKVTEILRNHLEEYSDAKGILIEDDLDDLDEKQAVLWMDEIRNRIQAIVGTIPVVILLAAPEIESWFIADWDNGFGQYRLPEVIGNEFSAQEGRYFDHHFRKYMEAEILGRYAGNPEEYGCQRPYKKLSEEIIRALESGENPETGEGFRSYLRRNGANSILTEKLIASNKLRYSKKEEGSRMLQQIDPDKVSEVCVKYFRLGLAQIRALE